MIDFYLVLVSILGCAYLLLKCIKTIQQIRYNARKGSATNGNNSPRN